MSARHWLAGLAIFLVALLAMAPARLLVYPVAHFSAGRVALTGVSGSLWHGRAESLDFPGRGGRPLRLEGIEWRFLPHRLLTGGAPLFIENGGGDLTLSGWLARAGAVTRPDGVRLIGFRLAAPLSVLAERFPARGNAEGDVDLRIDDLSLARPYAGKGAGELRLTDAGGRANITPGSYALTLEGRGERLAIRWYGPQGPRAMSGNAWWDGRLHLEGVPGAAP